MLSVGSGEASRCDRTGELAFTPDPVSESRESRLLVPTVGDCTDPYPMVDSRIANKDRSLLKIFKKTWSPKADDRRHRVLRDNVSPVLLMPFRKNACLLVKRDVLFNHAMRQIMKIRVAP